MKKSERVLLEELSDGLWHVYDKLPKGVYEHTVEACWHRGFVKTKKINLKREGSKREGYLETYRISLHITRQGRAALKGK